MKRKDFFKYGLAGLVGMFSISKISKEEKEIDPEKETLYVKGDIVIDGKVLVKQMQKYISYKR